MSCLACQQVDAIDGPASYTMIHIGRGGRERKGARIGGEGRGEGREGEEERTVHLFNTCHHALLLYKCYKFHKYSTAKALAMVIPASYPSLVLVSAC